MRNTKCTGSFGPRTAVGHWPTPSASPFVLALVVLLAAALVGCETSSYFVRHDDKNKPVPIASIPGALAVVRESRNPADRQRAFEYLGDPKHFGGDNAKRDEVAGILTLALSAEADVNLRITLVRSLGKLGSAQGFVGIQQAASDKDPAVRVAASKALGHIGGGDATEKLARLLESDSSLDVRLVAADVLGTLPSREAASALLAGLADPDVALRYRCRASLREMTGRDHPDADGWREEIQTANFEQLAGHKKLLGIF